MEAKENILITGITGSGGSYLADYVLDNHPDVKVWGICRWHSTSRLDNIEHMKDRIELMECDLLDFSSIVRVLQLAKPTKIFHLAAYANVRKCFDTPLAVVNNNIMGTANLLDAVRLSAPEAIVQMCSTSEVYGNPQTTPITESHPLNPVNPYAVSKLAQEKLAYAYHKSWGIRVIITRMFAYINPRRHDLFATAFARQIAQIEKDKGGTLRHGNLSSIRTLIDVRDAMESYWVACEKCQPGVPYNIGGKDTVTVGEFLEKLIEHARYPISKSEDKSLLRPVDVTKQIPETTMFDITSEWKPQYTLDDSIEFLLDHCRKEIQ